MKDWNKEEIAHYFNTKDLWKLTHDSVLSDENEQQIEKNLITERKMKVKRKAEHTFRTLPVIRKRSFFKIKDE